MMKSLCAATCLWLLIGSTALANDRPTSRSSHNSGKENLRGPAKVEQQTPAPGRTLEMRGDRASLVVRGAISIDGLDLVQDDESKQQVGDLDEFRGGDLTAARLVAFGHLGREYTVEYYTDFGYNGFDEGFDITNDDEFSVYNLEIRFPAARIGRLTIGKMKAPANLSRSWSGIYLPTALRAPAVTALTKSRDDGVRLVNAPFDKRMTWGVGLFNDWLSAGKRIDHTNTHLTGRLTGLILDDQDSDHLLQLGLGVRWTDSVEGTFRFRSRPGVPTVPHFVDTGAMSVDDARWFTGELAWRKRNLMIIAEHIRTAVDSPTAGDLTFTGSYAWVEWTLTGEARSWDYNNALPKRPEPSNGFAGGGKGLWSLALAVDDTDLSDGTIDGGDMQQVRIGVNWYPQRSYRWGLAYSRAWLDRDGVSSVADFLHLFIHVTNL